MLELAIILPVLLLLLFTTIEFGRVFSARLTVAAAAREGARYGIVGASDWEIKNRVSDFSANLNQSLVQVAVEKIPVVNPPSPGETVLRVTVRYPVEIVLPPLRGILPNPVWVEGAAAMRVE